MTFDCPPLCGECCGSVPFEKGMWERLKSKAVKDYRVAYDQGGLVIAPTRDGFCCFLNENKRCVVYASRPGICRKYGRIPQLPCPYIRMDGTRRSPAEAAMMKKVIDEEIDKKIEAIKRERDQPAEDPNPEPAEGTGEVA